MDGHCKGAFTAFTVTVLHLDTFSVCNADKQFIGCRCVRVFVYLSHGLQLLSWEGWQINMLSLWEEVVTFSTAWGCQFSYAWPVKGQGVINVAGSPSCSQRSSLKQRIETMSSGWQSPKELCGLMHEWPRKTLFFVFSFSKSKNDRTVTFMKNAVIQSQGSWGAFTCKLRSALACLTRLLWVEHLGNFTVIYVLLLKTKERELIYGTLEKTLAMSVIERTGKWIGRKY